MFDSAMERITTPTRAVAAQREIQIPGPRGDIRALAVVPRETSEPLPVLVWFHGGGTVMLSPDAELPAITAAAVEAVDTRWVYSFGDGTADGGADMKNLLGGKGANLAEMSNLGLPVPPGFTVTTEVCTAYYAADRSFPGELGDQVRAAVNRIGEIVGARFGDADNPLLVSVRSGARASMPGMMDTILNLGLNDDVARGMATHTGDARFVYDLYRRLVQMFGGVVLGVPDEAFEDALRERREAAGVQVDAELEADDWRLSGSMAVPVKGPVVLSAVE